MGFINFDAIAATKEAVLAEEGRYPLIIRDAEHDLKDDGRENIVLTIGFEAKSEQGEDLLPFRHWLSLPNSADDSGKVETKLRMLKRFLHLVNYIPSSNELGPAEFAEELIGLTFEGDVFQEIYEPDNGEPRVNNRLRVPRVDSNDPSPF